MARKKQIPDKITFKYIFEQDYNPVFITGAHGGVIPSGEIAINFYLERHALPKEETQRIEKDGKLGEVIHPVPEDLNESMVRIIKNGIIMTIPNAKVIHKWLGERIQEAENLQSLKTQKGDSSNDSLDNN